MSIRTFSRVTSACAFLVCVSLAACSDRASHRTGASIGAEGGEVALADGSAAGARVVVPPGAVDEDVRFTIVSSGAPSELAEGTHAVGPLVTFGPAGVAFALPVRIYVPAASEPMVVWTRPHAGGDWTRVDGAVWDPETGLVSAEVMHFSDFVPVAIAADAGAAVDGGDFCRMYPRDPACVTPPPVLPSCDPIVQDCTTGEKCIATDQAGGYDWGDGRDARCVTAGAVPEGGACAAANDCVPGTQCVFATMHDSGDGLTWFSQEEGYLSMYASSCQPICAHGGAACAAAGDVCNPLQLWGFSGRSVNEVYGVCAPPPPAPPPR